MEMDFSIFLPCLLSLFSLSLSASVVLSHYSNALQHTALISLASPEPDATSVQTVVLDSRCFFPPHYLTIFFRINI